MTVGRLLGTLAFVAIVSGALAAFPERSWATSYKLAISQVADEASGVTTTCAENAVCRVQFPVRIYERVVGLTVVSIFSPGNAYVRFESGGKPIAVGSNGYAHIALGTNKVASTTIGLQHSADWTYDEAPGSMFHWPVERGTSPLLTAVHVIIIRLD